MYHRKIRYIYPNLCLIRNHKISSKHPNEKRKAVTKSQNDHYQEMTAVQNERCIYTEITVIFYINAQNGSFSMKMSVILVENYPNYDRLFLKFVKKNKKIK